MHSRLWHDIFVLTLPVAEKIIRPVLVYVFLVIGFRLAGKRGLSPMNPFDLIVLLTISNAVQNAIIGEDNSVTGGLIGGGTLLLINYLVVRFLYKNPRAGKLIEGESDLLIKHGKVQQEILEHELISQNELEVAAHKQGLESLKDVWKAELETDGDITFVSRRHLNEEARHKEVMEHLGFLTRELLALKQAQNPQNPPEKTV